MIEIITDKMFDFVTSKSLEALNQLKAQYNNQLILYDIVKKFGESDFFKNEYHNILYNDRKDLILQIPDQQLSPTLTVQEISKNLYTPLLQIFISDSNEVKKITEIISTEYLSKRELTIKLLDLAIAEKEATEHILRDIGTTNHIVEKINSYNEKAEYRKKQILKKGLGRKMDLFIGSATRHYLTWIKKGDLTFVGGNSTPEIIQYMNQIKELIDSNFPQVTEDFHKIPVNILRTDKLPFKQQKIDSAIFAVYMRTILEKQVEDLLKLSNYLPDDFIYVLFEVLDIFEKSPIYNHNAIAFTKIFINATPADRNNMRENIVKELCDFGKVILKFEPLYHAYL